MTTPPARAYTRRRFAPSAPAARSTPNSIKGEAAMPAALAKSTMSADLARTRDRLAEIIKQKSLITEGGPFKLASGAMSDYYLDMKPTMFDAEGIALIAEVIFQMLADERDVDAVGGLELGAVPLAAAVCARSFPERPLQGFVVRKETKDHGTAKKIDGNFKNGARVVIIEDVTTKGGSSMQAIRAVRERGATVSRVISIVDRLEGAAENFSKEGIALTPIFTTRDLLGK
jgi:orotate phosphoribosyltransferase